MKSEPVFRLITRRSQVQILPPLPTSSLETSKRYNDLEAKPRGIPSLLAFSFLVSVTIQSQVSAALGAAHGQAGRGLAAKAQPPSALPLKPWTITRGERLALASGLSLKI